MSSSMRVSRLVSMVLLAMAIALALPAVVFANSSISGIVLDNLTGKPVPDITVYAVYWNASHNTWDAWDWANTALDGSYIIPDLPDGTYRVQFYDGLGAYREQFYLNAPSVDVATDVHVLTGSPAVNVSASSVPYPSVDGTVRSSKSGAPIEGMKVELFSWSGTAWQVAKTTSTRADGTYRFGALTDGTWRVKVSDPTGRFSSSFYNNAATIDAASDIVTQVGVDKPGIDLTMADETVPPVVSSDIVANYAGAANFTISAVDPMPASGVAAIYYRLDGGPETASAGSVLPMSVTGIGSHTISYRAVDNAGNSSAVVTKAFAVVAGPVPTARIAGADRYDTAVAVARQGRSTLKGVDHIIIACGEDRALADPLTASGLTWAYNYAPLVLTRSGSVPASVVQFVADTVAANGGITLTCVGGQLSIPDARIAEIRAGVAARLGMPLATANAVVQLDRIAAPDRYQLGAAVAVRMNDERPLEFGRFGLVANGQDPAKFFDALALSSVTARRGCPILLVKTASVPASTTAVMAKFGFTGRKVLVAGGTASVTPQVLVAMKVGEGQRMAGPNRYATAVTVANRAIAEGLLADRNVGLASKVTDALSGGAFSGMRNSPVLVVSPTALPAETAGWLRVHRANLAGCWVFGGPRSVSAGVVSAASNLLK